MNAAFLVVAVLCLGFMVAIPWAIWRDSLDAHLMHGPDDECAECGEP
jgi:hypothetical protein